MWTLPSWVLGRKTGPKITPGARTVPLSGQSDLWWVKVILNVGRPVVAVIVLVMCAPGEHYLARLAGWSHWLAWGMPATLTAYAGIAAVVATKRPKKSPGKKTAVAGAIISVALAMGAQPIAHLYERGLVTGHQFLLTIIVSCIPALVFGHLLHMAAAPVIVPGALVFDGVQGVDLAPAVSRLEDADLSADRISLLPDATMEVVFEEDTEPGPDSMTYQPGDEDGMDAGLDTLRGVSPSDAVIRDMVAAAQEQIYGGEDPFPSFEDNYVRRVHPAVQALIDESNVPVPDYDRQPWLIPRPDVQAPVSVSRDMSMGDNAPASGNGALSPDSVPPVVHVDGRDMSMGVPATVTVSRDVPARRPGTGITQRVRDMLEINPTMTNEAIQDACPGDNRDSVKRATNRVRKELGLITD